jgi:hypothetical protein
VEFRKVLTEEEKEENAKLDEKIADLSLFAKFSFYRLAIKYYFSGDDWLFAKGYALSLVAPWERNNSANRMLNPWGKK